ncbi:MAG: Ribosomal large subunit pseudouridine synthase B [Cryomorphaceae bacterium]|nr:MAG: Ribosomal large subunit pseudouridine synthase B [Cryomorphaceae bacterium]
MRNSRSSNNGPRRGKSQNSNNRFASGPKKTWDREEGGDRPERGARPAKKYRGVRSKTAEQLSGTSDEVRLNKYLSNAGICSRREADDLIGAGLVSVNNKVVTSMGYKVKPSDVVKYNGTTLKTDKMRYVLLNKPKGFLASMDDPKARKTVFDLVGNACNERIYPVGQMERGSTGVLLLTNDADTAKKLTKGVNGAANIYHIVLDKPLSKQQLDKIAAGTELEDGKVRVEEINFTSDKNPRELGMRIHENKPRIVRRLFAHYGFEVEKLDRVSFAGLTKKRLNRGDYRHLDAKEVGFLKTR